MRLINGIADAAKCAVMRGDIQTVTVTDGDREIRLSLGSAGYDAGLSIEQAIYIAEQLKAAAMRLAEKDAGEASSMGDERRAK